MTKPSGDVDEVEAGFDRLYAADFLGRTWVAEWAAKAQTEIERLRAQVEELTAILDSHRIKHPEGLPTWACEAEIEQQFTPLERIMIAMCADTLARDKAS